MKTKIIFTTVLLLCILRNNSFGQTNYHSRISNSQSSTITYSISLDIVTISTNLISSQTEDLYSTFVLNDLTISNNIVYIPNDGSNYWLVSFDPNVINPVTKLQNGGVVVIECNCSGDANASGVCKTTMVGNCFQCCNESCSHECTMTSSEKPQSSLILKAESLYYNSVHYFAY